MTRHLFTVNLGFKMLFSKNINQFFKYHQLCTRTLCTKRTTQNDVRALPHIPEPEHDIKFLCNPSNRDIIFHNVKARKGIGNIDRILELSKEETKQASLLQELNKMPNQTHPTVLSYDKEPQILREYGFKPNFDFEAQDFLTLISKLNLLKNRSLGPLIGQRGYIFLGDLAELEEALIHYTVKELMRHGFKLISVPDIIPTKVIERCGLISDNGRTLVYNLNNFYGEQYSLSGTAEMSLAYKVMNTLFNFADLPLKMAAVSRCFRAETSKIMEERGIYRVHQFTKVEMFVCSEHEKSTQQFQELQEIQENLFSSLNLHFRVLDMPPQDLGAPAYRKVDIEGWMPGRKLYGELSSCSNCTDYQSRRLNIKYKAKSGEILHVHTLNGTACAIPRMLIALCETYQTKYGCINVPEVLKPYIKGKSLIKKHKGINMKFHKHKQHFE